MNKLLWILGAGALLGGCETLVPSAALPQSEYSGAQKPDTQSHQPPSAAETSEKTPDTQPHPPSSAAVTSEPPRAQAGDAGRAPEKPEAPVSALDAKALADAEGSGAPLDPRPATGVEVSHGIVDGDGPAVVEAGAPLAGDPNPKVPIEHDLSLAPAKPLPEVGDAVSGQELPRQGDGEVHLTPTSTGALKPPVVAPRPSLTVANSIMHTPIDTRNAIAPLNAEATVKLAQAIADTNQLRAEKGLPPLKFDPILSAYAQQRAYEIVGKFAHQRPNGQSSLEGFEGKRDAGENIAAGNASADDTVLEQWRHSPGHYANIISKDFKDIGMGYVHVPDSKYRDYWTQIFGTKNGRRYRSDYFFYSEPDWQALANAANFDADGRLQLEKSTQDTLTIPLNQGNRARLFNPALAGFQYQTFGHIEDDQERRLSYVNLGLNSWQPLTSFAATYHGKVRGMIGDQRAQSDLTAHVDFSSHKKQMDFVLSNTTLENNIPYANGNFRATLNWGQKHFSSPGIEAYFYGPHQEELGGHFVYPIQNQESYRGAFGAKRN